MARFLGRLWMHKEEWRAAYVSRSLVGGSAVKRKADDRSRAGRKHLHRMQRPASSGYALVTTEGKELSAVPWNVALTRSDPRTLGSIGVVFHVPDPDHTGGDDFISAEAVVPGAQFDQLLQLLKLSTGDLQLGIGVSGLTYGKGPLDVTRVWKLPDTLQINEARVSVGLTTAGGR